MNIYLIQEDGLSFCVRAKTMGEAVSICEASFLDDSREADGVTYNEEEAKQYYHEQILSSCALVGELKN